MATVAELRERIDRAQGSPQPTVQSLRSRLSRATQPRVDIADVPPPPESPFLPDPNRPEARPPESVTPPPIPEPQRGPDLERLRPSVAESTVKAVPRGAVETTATALSPLALGERRRIKAVREMVPEIRAAETMDREQADALVRRIQKAPNLSSAQKLFLTRAAYRVRNGLLDPDDVPEYVRHAETAPASATQEELRTFAEETFPIPPEHEARLPVQVGRGVGSAGAFVGTRMLTGPAGLMLFAGSVGSGEAIENAIAEGASDEETARAGLLGIAPGLTDMVPVERLLRPVSHIPGVKGALYSIARKAVEQGAIEGTQEGVQQFMQNAISKITHTPEKELTEGIAENGLVGFLVGTLFGSAAGTIQTVAPTGRAEEPGAAAPPDIEGLRQRVSQGRTEVPATFATEIRAEAVPAAPAAREAGTGAVPAETELVPPGPVYHGTQAGEISLFNPGTHFGSQAAAQDRLRDTGGGGRVMPVRLNIRKPLDLPDLGEWMIEDVAKVLRDRGVLTDEDYSTVIRTPNDETIDGKSADQFLIDRIREQGYDSITYVNETEDPGSRSWMVLDPSQAGTVEPKTARADIDRKRQRKPRTVMTIIRSMGGIKPSAETRARDLHLTAPGMVSARGRTLHEIREHFEEIGLLPEGSYDDAVFDLIDQHLQPGAQPVVHPEDLTQQIETPQPVDPEFQRHVLEQQAREYGIDPAGFPDTDELSDAILEAVDERLAIQEFDGDQADAEADRIEAEADALIGGAIPEHRETAGEDIFDEVPFPDVGPQPETRPEPAARADDRAGAEEADAVPGRADEAEARPAPSETGAETAREGGERVEPLYASRPVANAEDIIAWAREQGFKSTLPAEDMHVTVAYSREPVDWSAVNEADTQIGSGPDTRRSIEKLGEKGAIVLHFQNDRLQKRWRQYRRAGASWDFDGYRPHITISYDAGGLDLSKIEPYRGPIILGPEQQKPLDTDFEPREVPTTTTESTAAGEQTVIPGAERISAREQIERRMQGRQRAESPQQPADEGLFDVEGRRQTDIEDVTGEPQPRRPKTLSSRAPQSMEAGERHRGFRQDTFDPDQPALPPKEEPLTREAVLAPLAADLGVPLYEGRVKGKRRRGFFRTDNEEVRIKNHADIETAAHEFAHLLDKRFPEIRKQWQPGTAANEAIRKELAAVSYDKDKLYEGFAEFVRLWATQRTEAANRAPRFYDWFERFVSGNRHGPALRRAQEQMHAWFDQAAIDRARSKVGRVGDVNEAFRASLGNRFRQGALDDLQAVLDAEAMLTGENIGPIYQNARLTRGVSGTVQAALLYGAPAWRGGQIVLLDRDGNPTFTVEGGRVVENAESKPWGLEKILAPVSHDLQSFGLYAVGRRAKFLKGQGRENLFTNAEIEAMLALETPERKAAFEQWNEFNSQVLDFAQQSGLIDPEARAGWETGVYLPFWRVTADRPQASGPRGRPSGEVQIIKRLRGGTANIGDPIANMHQNIRLLIEAAVHNQARRQVVDMVVKAEGESPESPGGARFLAKIPKTAKKLRIFVESAREGLKERYAEIRLEEIEALARSQQGRENQDIVIEAAEQAQQDAETFDGMVDELFDSVSGTMAVWQNNLAPTGSDIVAVMRNGKAEYYEVADELLWHSLTAMPRRIQQNALMRLLKGFRRMGQRTVTWSVDFVWRNIFRDQFMASVLSRNGYHPFVDAARGFKSRLAHDATYKAWIANGGGMASFWSDEAAFERHLRTYYERHGIAYDLVINNPRKFLYFVDRFFDAFETATRLGEFKRSLKGGRTARQAAFESREVSTDFAMRGDPRLSVLVSGDASTLGVLYDTVLFLKAGTVGVDRVYRGFRHYDNRGKVALRTAMIATATLGLYALNRLYNKDEYDELPDWDRDVHWHVWIPDGKGGKHHFRFPKPWEIGGIATISERAVEGVIDQDPSQAPKILNVVREMFRYEYIPFFVAPMVEQYANRQRFFDRPIEPPGVESLEPFARATPQTSETIRRLGEATRKLPRAMQLPPARTEHLIRAYFNTWAHYGLMLADQAFFDDIPDLRIDEYPLARTMFRKDPQRSTRYQTMFYDMMREATETRRTMRAMDKQFRPDIADDLEQKRQNLEYTQLSGANETLQGINAEIRLVTRMPDLASVQRYASDLGRERDKAAAISKLRLSRHWNDIGTLKREIIDLWLEERNEVFREVVKDIEAQREDEAER